MIALLVIFAHLAFDIVFGAAILRLRNKPQSVVEVLLSAVLLGMYAETMAAGSLMFLGLSLSLSGMVTAGAMAVATVTLFYWKGFDYSRPMPQRPKWYEWALLLAAGEKIAFAVWQLARTQTYFDDALTHWSGRSRSLFAGVNWSFDPASPLFMGGHIGNRTYPLLVVIWRALSARLNGGWNEVISRADGLIFFIVVLATIWLSVWTFSRSRPLAAAATFVSSAIPLHAWHAAAGYSDIAVEAFVLVGLASLLREEWLAAGIMAAGAVWSKNDSLFLYVPALFLVCCLLQRRRETAPFDYRNPARFLLGFATVAPWLIFNLSNGLGLTSGQGQIAFHPEAPGLLLKALVISPTSGILWIGIFAAAIYGSTAMFKDRTGRTLLLAFLTSFGAIVFTFSASSAFTFLENELTIHRVLMQFSGMAIVVVTYGLSLTTARSVTPISPPRGKKGKSR